MVVVGGVGHRPLHHDHRATILANDDNDAVGEDTEVLESISALGAAS